MINIRPANNFRFRCEADALYHASRVAMLQIGSYVTFRDTDGMHNGVVVRISEAGTPIVATYDPEDRGLTGQSVPHASILFDDMPEEWVDKPACEDEGDEYEDEFPRT